jgi:multicomponent Na+:H+ antiporter subunit B
VKHASDRDDLHRGGLAAVVVAALAVVFAIGLLAVPRDNTALPWLARHAMHIALPKWGTTEVVSEVVYGSRGWDTFGETFLLLAAVISVSLLSRGREPRSEYVGEANAGRREQRETDPAAGENPDEEEARSAEREESSDEPAPDDADDDPLAAPAPERAAAMTVVIRVAARTVAPILAVAAVYLCAWGYTPGGGFPGGAAITGVVILLYAALGHRAVRRVVRPTVLESIELVGAMVIVAVGVVGIFSKGAAFANWLPLGEQQTIRAGGTLQVFSGAEFFEVATGLSIAVFSLLGMGHDWAPDADDENTDEDEDNDADENERSDVRP